MKILIEDSDVEWVVNQCGELGVRIGGQNFYLYKGNSLSYSKDPDTDDINVTGNDPRKWRKVEKREFGETCHRVGTDGQSLLDRYNNSNFDWNLN